MNVQGGIVQLITPSGIIGVYFPRELTSQIHCYMTGLDPN